MTPAPTARLRSGAATSSIRSPPRTRGLSPLPDAAPRRRGPSAMTATASESEESLTDSRFARALRLLKLLLTVLTLAVSLLKALGLA